MWILVNIGCLHCNVSSQIVGVFRDEAKAIKLRGELQSSHGERDGGQNEFQVFPMPAFDVIHHEYLKPAA